MSLMKRPFAVRKSNRQLLKENLALQLERDNLELLVAALVLETGETRTITDADIKATADVKSVKGQRVEDGYKIVLVMDRKKELEMTVLEGEAVA